MMLSCVLFLVAADLFHLSPVHLPKEVFMEMKTENKDITYLIMLNFVALQGSAMASCSLVCYLVRFIYFSIDLVR